MYGPEKIEITSMSVMVLARFGPNELEQVQFLYRRSQNKSVDS